MGAGLAFLNKKSWHTGGFKSKEAVWKREQEVEEEKRRVEELKAQILQERELKELKEVGGQGDAERVEFLYSGPLAARAEEDKRAEEFLLGKAVERLPGTSDKGGDLRAAEPELLARLAEKPAAVIPDSANERWSRLHGDPLLAMQQRQVEASRRVRENPVQMARLREEVARKLDERRARKEERREEKRARKEKRRVKREERQKSDYPRQGREGHGGDNRRERDGDRRLRRRSQSPRRRERDGDPDSRPKDRSRGEGEGGRLRERSRSPLRREHGERGRDGATAQGADVQYGLNRNSENPYSARTREGGKERYEGRMPQRDNRHYVPENWSGRSNTSRHTAGRLSEAERARRLAEMTANANHLEEEKGRRIQRAKDQEQVEGGNEAANKHHAEKPIFMQDAERNVYGAGNQETLEERVGRRKFFSNVKS